MKNKNLWGLLISNWAVITYAFGGISYLLWRGYISGDPGVGEMWKAYGLLMISLGIVVWLAMGRIRSWIIFVIHVIVFAIFMRLGYPGNVFGLWFFAHMLFGAGLWLMLRFGWVLPAMVGYTFSFVGVVYLGNSGYLGKHPGDIYLVRWDLLLLLVGFFGLLGLLMCWENLLLVARKLKQPRKQIKPAWWSWVVLLIMLVLPAVFGIWVGVRRMQFKRIAWLNEQMPLEPGGGWGQPYGKSFYISEFNSQLFTAVVDRDVGEILPLRVFSYGYLDRTSDKLVPAENPTRQLVSGYSVFDEPELKTGLLKVGVTYEFGEAYRSRYVPHLLTATETNDIDSLFIRDDLLGARSELYQIKNLHLDSQVVVGPVEQGKEVDRERWREFLAVPFDDQLAQVTEQFRGEPNVGQRIEDILSFLKAEYTYGIDEVFMDQKQSNKSFLFLTKKGTSIDFAEGMTLLLRASGVPARMVGGYVVDLDPYAPRVYPVFEANRLFWVEAYVPGVGWRSYFPVNGLTERAALVRYYLHLVPEGEEKESTPGGTPRVTPVPTPRNLPLPTVDPEQLEKRKEELKKLEEEKKRREEDLKKAEEITRMVVKILGIAILICIGGYVAGYPWWRRWRILTHQRRVEWVYKWIVDVAVWFGVNVPIGAVPTRVTGAIEKQLGVDLKDMGWIYNRAVLRGKLHEGDEVRAAEAFEVMWKRCFSKISWRGVLYFYRI